MRDKAEDRRKGKRKRGEKGAKTRLVSVWRRSMGHKPALRGVARGTGVAKVHHSVHRGMEEPGEWGSSVKENKQF